MGRRTIHLALLATLVVPLLMCPSTQAIEQQSGAIAQGYKSDTSGGKITGGSLISLKKNSSDTVELATNDSAVRLVGVADGQPLVALAKSDTKVQAVISGTTRVLVSDINGTIAGGDKIAPSPIAGTGMKATTDGQIVGTARSNFTEIKTASITDTAGETHTVRVGYVIVQVSPAFYQMAGSSVLPPFIQQLANNLAGRQVSLMRILIAGLVLLIGFVSIIVLVYGGVRSAMTSLGRNPLAARDIRRGLYQILLIAIVVAGGAALASYLVLRT